MRKGYHWLIAFMLIGLPLAANAALTYDYAGDTLFDSGTGLYWTLGEVPSNTGVPATPWSVASSTQLTQLQSDVLSGAGLPVTGYQLLAPYQSATFQPALSNYVAFFQSDTPGPSASFFTSGGTLGADAGFVNGTLCPGCGSADGVLFGGPIYQYSARSGGSWTLGINVTTATYSWADPPGCMSGGYCPAGDAAWLVSSLNPVPLPVSLWLLLSGLLGLGAWARSGTMRRCKSPHPTLN